MKKEDFEKKRKIKELIFKIIHSITYVFSALFIIVCITVGVQSCNSKKNKSNQNVSRSNLNGLVKTNLTDDFLYSYVSKYQTSGTLSVDFQSDFSNALGGASLNFNETLSHNPGDTYKVVNLNDVYIYNNESGEFYSVDKFYVLFSGYAVTGLHGFYRIRLNYINFSANGQWLTYVQKTNGDPSNLSYTFNDVALNYQLYFYTALSDNNNAVFDYFFNENILNSFIYVFNNQINYNGFYNGALSSPYIPYSNLSVNIDLPLFFSGGQLYNRIHLQFTDAYGSDFLDDKGNVFTLNANPNTYMTYLYMEYVNTYNNKTTLVNNRDFGVHYSGSAILRYSYNTSSWVSNNYTRLKFVSDVDSDSLITLSKFNSNTSNINNGSSYYNVGLGDVFTLLSNSFMAIFPLISIQIIPGLTIGLLLFLPLIVSIIILVFKAVKK